MLAIDTSTEACSAAVAVGNDIISRYEYAPRRHAELILPMVEDLLLQADVSLQHLDCLAFGRGPGAFTGVRIATGVIQGLALGSRLPVVPVSTLAALAQGVADRGRRLLSAIDARMHEVYYCAYEVGGNGLVAPVMEECLGNPEDIVLPTGAGWFGVGSGWNSYREILLPRIGNRLMGHDGDRYPDARQIIALAQHDFAAGKAVPGDAALPIYLRDQVTG